MKLNVNKGILSDSQTQCNLFGKQIMKQLIKEYAPMAKG